MTTNRTTIPTCATTLPGSTLHTRRRVPRAAAIMLLAGGLASTASAQWTVTILDPSGSIGSIARGVRDGQQVGTAALGGASVATAAVWSGGSGTYVDLGLPENAIGTVAWSVSNGVQAGWALMTGVSNHAGLWTGTAESWVDLNPTNASNVVATDSMCRGMVGNLQVGYAAFGSGAHAGYWSGTAASFVDINPVGASRSNAYNTDGTQITGYARIGTKNCAALWTAGTAASFVNLNPGTATGSNAWGVSNGRQAGSATFGAVFYASLWSGTAASWVNLNPAGASLSLVWSMEGNVQVGYARFYHPEYAWDFDHASVWTGTAGSWVDLRSLLPEDDTHFYTDTYAQCIWSDANNTYIAGYGSNDISGHVEALLWTKPICHADFNYDGFVDGIDYDQFNNDFESFDPVQQMNADYNGDGFVDGIDYDLFNNDFAVGC